MISLPLFKKEIKSNYKILLIFMAILALYVPIMVYMFDPKLGDMLKQFEEAMPGMMSAMGMTSAGNDLISFLDSYLFGFILIVFPMIFTIMLANKLVAGYVDSGSMACILASPNTRKKIIFTQILVMIINILLLVLFSTILAIVTSEIMFPGQLNIKNYILMSLSLFLLQLAVAGISFLASCIFNESKNSFLFGAGIPILLYLVNMLANMGGNLENLKYATIFTLLPSSEIAAGKTDILLPILILVTISIVLYSVGAYIFTKKDLPL
ncbi:ABC transporter permease subunit [Sedimentibacter sp. zth1]|uniref:ABC transporter permease subunit n=1 Tax=Sedimentibacter sp. zth1 TaxID=2816908 RepID=UPI001A91A3F1|nr:ABC transporter permease subunit [Sedimentibacter sp. zth1]QSX05737.1 ABC transporter permease subunit [Sedimentibacter sp. zth1]